MMKFYIAGRTTERKQVKQIFKILESKNHEVAFDWTWHKNIKPYSKNKKTASQYAIEDIDGLYKCDVFVLLTSEQAGTGSTTEFGAALALNMKMNKPRVYVIGNHLGVNMFFFHPNVRVKKDINAVLKDISPEV